MPRLEPPKLPAVKRQPRFDGIDPFDGRYFDTELARYLSEATRVTYQAHVEAALAHALADFDITSRKVANEIEAASRKITVKEVYKEEGLTKHDIKALVNRLKRRVSPAARPYIHLTATSYDIVANAAILQLRTAMEELVLPRLSSLILILAKLADQYADTTQIGRTHGQHGIPITFGFALAEYVSRLGESYQTLHNRSDTLTGKFSGAVGAYNASGIFVKDPLKFEESVLAYLDLKPAELSTQITPPEQLIRLLDELANTAGIMANLGHDMRHLQRSEIAEVRERFEPGQTGSSTMAHKRNPWNFENVVSMSKQVLAQLMNAKQNLSSEHQRDLTDSASARFYPLMLAGVASMAKRLATVMKKVEVDEEAMQRNLQLSGGAIAAEPLYLMLAKLGHPQAHETAKKLAHQAQRTEHKLHEVVQERLPKYWAKLTDQEQQIIIAPEIHYTGLAAKKARQVARRWGKLLA